MREYGGKGSMNKINAPDEITKNHSACANGAKFKPGRRNGQALLAFTFTAASRVKWKCYYILR